MENNITFTDPQSIIDAADAKLEEFKAARSRLNQVSIKFTDAVDRLNNANLKDGTILRDRMKDSVIRASTHREL